MVELDIWSWNSGKRPELNTEISQFSEAVIVEVARINEISKRATLSSFSLTLQHLLRFTHDSRRLKATCSS